MLLVTQTAELQKRFGIEKAIQMIAEAGFDAIDFSMFEMNDDNSILNSDKCFEYAKKLKEIAQKSGIRFVQAHAPFEYSHCAPQSDVDKMTIKVKRAIEIASVMGVEIIVVHPLQHMDYTTNVKVLHDMNIEYYKMLGSLGQKLGIKIAVENMFQTDKNTGKIKDSTCASHEEFCEYLDTINNPNVVGCLDIGHCRLCSRDPGDMLKNMGKDRIKCFHVHDNDFVRDCHAIPYTHSLNWDEICKAVADSGYMGNLTFECDKSFLAYDDEFMSVVLKFMHDTGRHLIRKIKSNGI